MTGKSPKSEWYIRTENGVSGPYSKQQIRDFAANGELLRQSSISKNQEGPWTVAENARGLFSELPKLDSEQVQATSLTLDPKTNEGKYLYPIAFGALGVLGLILSLYFWAYFLNARSSSVIRYLFSIRLITVLQLVILALSVLIFACSIFSFFGKIQLDPGKPLSKQTSILVGIGLLIGSAVVAYLAIILNVYRTI